MLKIIFFISIFIYQLQVYTQGYKLIDVYSEKDTSNHLIVQFEDIFFERWDTLAQPKFWKKIMTLDPDTCIVNIATTRQFLGYEKTNKWASQTEEEKLRYKDSVRLVHDLHEETKIYITSGKKYFYLIDETIPSISKAVDIFQDLGTDPLYAQAILLIESPGKLNYSNAGAYGPFQLMKSVARAEGLIVNKELDERKDFVKSAYAASSLLNNICVPEAKRILNKLNIEFNESDLWFKFLVLHTYHAGARNVEGLLDQLDQSISGKKLIQWIWQNEWGAFKNASQNYTQVAIAALLCLQDEIYNKCDYIFECNPF